MRQTISVLFFCASILVSAVHASWWMDTENGTWKPINLPHYGRTAKFLNEEFFVLRSFNVNLQNNVSETNLINFNENTILVNRTIWILSSSRTVISPDRAILSVADNYTMSAMIVASTQIPAGIETTRPDATCDSARLRAVAIPVVEMSRADHLTLENLIRDNKTIIIRLSPDDLNAWTYLANSAPVTVGIALNLLFSLLAAILAIRSLRRFFLKLGRALSLPTVILTMLLLCDLARMAWLLCIPFFYRGMVPMQISYWLLLLPWPFALCALLLWAMYWNELISRSRATPIVFLEKHGRWAWLLQCEAGNGRRCAAFRWNRR
eukprot:TRINITY_DN2151_c0_g2_i2.p2 TRINITY_DN2151_c0_g2~~TRINITY_DN2151_c0_g2_i2.p2  ORF type:complete len:322 (+),score=28.42 TRINITY_DN2151_c0_g2_i2:1697-2662(+)